MIITSRGLNFCERKFSDLVTSDVRKKEKKERKDYACNVVKRWKKEKRVILERRY